MRAISGHISANNVVEYLVIITKKKVVGRFGIAKGKDQKQFNFNIDEK